MENWEIKISEQIPERRTLKIDVSELQLNEYSQDIDALIDFLKQAKIKGATTCEFSAYIPWGEGYAESFDISTYYSREETDKEMDAKRTHSPFTHFIPCVMGLYHIRTIP